MTKILVISNKERDLTTISALLNDLVSNCLVITCLMLCVYLSN